MWRIIVGSFGRATSSRGFATEATTSIMKLTLTSPHETILAKKEVYQVNIPATTGDMGVLAQHVPSIEQIRPGMVEVFHTPTQKSRYFVSGGFAVIHPDSHMVINVVEAVTPDQLDIEVRCHRNQSINLYMS
jgi:F-type H+-transporting ATPase subunit delta